MTIILPDQGAGGISTRPPAGADAAMARLRSLDEALYVAAETAKQATAALGGPKSQSAPERLPPSAAARDLVSKRVRAVTERRLPATALAQEADQTEAQLREIENGADALEDAIARDPSVLADLLPLATDLSRSLVPLSGEDAARRFERDTRVRLGRRAARTMIEQDPGAARDALDAGPLADTLPRSGREKMRAAAKRCAMARRADTARREKAAADAAFIETRQRALHAQAAYHQAIEDGGATEEALVMAVEDGVLSPAQSESLRAERKKTETEKETVARSARAVAARLEDGQTLAAENASDRNAAADHFAVVLLPILADQPPAEQAGLIERHARVTGILTDEARDRLLVLAAAGDPADRVRAAAALHRVLQIDPAAGEGVPRDVLELLTGIARLSDLGAAETDILDISGLGPPGARSFDRLIKFIMDLFRKKPGRGNRGNKDRDIPPLPPVPPDPPASADRAPEQKSGENNTPELQSKDETRSESQPEPDIDSLNDAVDRAVPEGAVLDPGRRKDVSEINEKLEQEFKKNSPDEEYHPSYKPGTKIIEFSIGDGAKRFVRVYSKKQFKTFEWIARLEDVEGLSPGELKEKFALRFVPKFVTGVTLPPGTRVRVGIVNPHPEWGAGNAVQFEILDKVRPSWFSEGRKIEE